MTARVAPRLLLAFLALVAVACSHPSPPFDAGTPECKGPADCKLAGFDGACRSGACVANVPCADDVECGLGESCVARQCRFTGCTADADCPHGTCRTASFACTECSKSGDCPALKPVCGASGHCVQCGADSDCPAPGPAVCDAIQGQCVQCTQDVQCPNGLGCGIDRMCHGVGVNLPCSVTSLCDTGLVCVTLNGNQNVCLEGCQLYAPQCQAGQICVKLTFSMSASLVYDNGMPLGVCSAPLTGLKSYGQSCSGAACEPNLQCIPDVPGNATCHGFCDPAAPGCPSGQMCHAFPGDAQGHQYGVCYGDNGWGAGCVRDIDCRAGEACTPMDNPSVSAGLSDFCAFDVGPAPGMSPCDAGAQCASGYCVSANLFDAGTPTFCFGACQADIDCVPDGGVSGSCDARITFSSAFSAAQLPGCLPRCASPADCAVPDAGLTCRAGVIRRPSGTPSLVQTCEPPGGPGTFGTACAQASDCREGLCLVQDARGVVRQGRCLTPCAGNADCDGGCLAQALIGSLGPDGAPGTADDVDVVGQLCTGAACKDDSDCSPSYSRCTVDVDPLSPASGLGLYCRAPSLAGTLDAGAVCATDGQCPSGACAQLGPPSTGTGKTCLVPCVAGRTACGTGLTCRAGAATLAARDGTVHSFDACAP